MRFAPGQLIIRRITSSKTLWFLVISVDPHRGYRAQTLMGNAVWFNFTDEEIFTEATMSFGGPVGCDRGESEA